MHRVLRASTESVFGTRAETPAFSSYTPMDQPNSFKLMTTRPPWTIQDGTGRNEPRLRGSEVVVVAGKYTTRAYWETVQQYMGWLTRINSAQTSPWPTNQKILDYASMTFDFGYTFDDESMKRVSYLGCKPGQSVRLDCANTPDNPFLMMDIDIIGAIPIPNPYSTLTAPDATAFPEPDPDDLPRDPLVFQETVFTALGTIQSFFDRFSITINSKIQGYMDNSRFANRIRNRGRTVTLTVHPLLEVQSDARLKYEAVQAMGQMDIEFRKGNSRVKFDFRSNTFLDSVAEEMILDQDAYNEWTATALIDTATGDSFTITTTIGT